MVHTSKGAIKILDECTLPLTAVGVVDLIITEKGVIKVTPEGLVITEVSPYSSIEDIKASTGAELKVADDVKILTL